MSISEQRHTLSEPTSPVPAIDVDAWLAAFEREHGRPLRVLHIGNIANNAYRNGKLQRAAGIEADVVCYDYYHVMGCPEWEDAELGGPYDAFFPDWWDMPSVTVARPDWFIQGPLKQCLDHMRARQSGDARKHLTSRLALVQAYADLIDDRAGRERRNVMAPMYRRGTERLAPELVNQPKWLNRIRSYAKRIAAPHWRDGLIHHSADEVAGPPLRRGVSGADGKLADRQRVALARNIRRLARSTPHTEPHWQAYQKQRQAPAVLARLAAGLAASAALSPFLRSRDVAAHNVEDMRRAQPSIIERYRAERWDATATDIESDLEAATARATLWSNVLAYYDIVQGYSIDGQLPLFAGHPCFVAYEHGTIRNIPFEADERGRLCRFTYKYAPRVLITNTDVLPAADRIPIEPVRRVCIPHAFDDAPLHAFRAQHEAGVERSGRAAIFSPTRHHWQVFDPSLSKGNDVLFKGAAIAARAGADFELHLVEWGQEVEASRKLVTELGIADRVVWQCMVNRTELWLAMLRAHAVADQFSLPALGGVGYEALTLGARLITSLDEAASTQFFGACPPVLRAATPQAVADAIHVIVADPHDHARRGAEGVAWTRRFHSSARLQQLHISAYRDVLGGDDARNTVGAPIAAGSAP